MGVKTSFRIGRPVLAPICRFSRRLRRRRPALRDIAGAVGGHVLILVFAVAAFIAALGAFGAILDHEWLTRLDRRVDAWVQVHRTPVLDLVFGALTRLGDIITISVLLGALVVYLLVSGRRVAAAFTVAGVAATQLLVFLLKIGIGRTRPSTGLNTFSFPSGHTTMAVVTYVLVGVVSLRGRARRWQVLGAGALALSIAVVAASRVYLGVHWLSDVAGAVALAFTVLSVLVPAVLIGELTRDSNHRGIET